MKRLMKSGAGFVTAILLASIGVLAPGDSRVALADNGLVSMHDLFGIPGPVIHNPLVRLIFWGSEWVNGWIDPNSAGNSNPYGLGSESAKAYMTNFFTYMGSPPVGGNTWHYIFEYQYCDNVPSGAIHCRDYSYPQYIGGMSGLLGVTVDNVTVPSSPSRDDIEAEVNRISAQYYNYGGRVIYVVFLPTGKYVAGSVLSCNSGAGHHFNLATPTIAYAWVNYPVGNICHDWVNTDDALGHGYFDFLSIAAGHEWAEAVTDPATYSWHDTNTAGQVADKCTSSTFPPPPNYPNYLNFGWYGGYDHFAVQRIWTNEWNGVGGCAYR